MTESTPHVLPYRGRADRPPPLPSFYRTFAFRWVVKCWAAPLGMGLAAFAAFMMLRAMRSKQGMDAAIVGGFIVVILGMASTLNAVGILSASLAPRWRNSGDRIAEVVLPGLIAAGLLASNFVMAGTLGLIAFADVLH